MKYYDVKPLIALLGANPHSRTILSALSNEAINHEPDLMYVRACSHSYRADITFLVQKRGFTQIEALFLVIYREMLEQYRIYRGNVVKDLRNAPFCHLEIYYHMVMTAIKLFGDTKPLDLLSDYALEWSYSSMNGPPELRFNERVKPPPNRNYEYGKTLREQSIANIIRYKLKTKNVLPTLLHNEIESVVLIWA